VHGGFRICLTSMSTIFVCVVRVCVCVCVCVCARVCVYVFVYCACGGADEFSRGGAMLDVGRQKMRRRLRKVRRGRGVSGTAEGAV